MSRTNRGRTEVYVRAFPNPSGRWQISTDGGGEPRWSTDGSEIFYRTNDQVYSVTVRSTPVFTVGQRELLFEGAFRQNTNHADYDINPVTGDFVMLRAAQETTASLVVVLNWLQELLERVSR